MLCPEKCCDVENRVYISFLEFELLIWINKKTSTRMVNKGGDMFVDLNKSFLVWSIKSDMSNYSD